MLFGSLSGLPGAGLLVRSTRAIGLVSTGAGGLAARSSTLAGACCSGVVAHPAATAAAARVAMMARRMASFSFLSFCEWSPGRLAHVARRHAQALLDAAVRRHRRQHAAFADHGGEQDHPPVGSKARMILLATVIGERGVLSAVSSRIIRPLGAKLGDSSRSLSVMICTWRL